MICRKGVSITQIFGDKLLSSILSERQDCKGVVMQTKKRRAQKDWGMTALVAEPNWKHCRSTQDSHRSIRSQLSKYPIEDVFAREAAKDFLLTTGFHYCLICHRTLVGRVSGFHTSDIKVPPSSQSSIYFPITFFPTHYTSKPTFLHSAVSH